MSASQPLRLTEIALMDARREIGVLQTKLEAMEQLIEQVGLAPVAPEIFIEDYNKWLAKLRGLAAAQEEQESLDSGS